MKRAVFYCLVLGMLAVVLSGCAGDGTRPISTDYRQGTRGLVIGFVDGLPPNEVYQEGNFKIGLKLQNKGAYRISRGTIEVTGMDKKYVLLPEKKKDLQPIEGKGMTSPEGGFYIEEFSGEVLKVLKKAKEYEVNYYAVANYDYRTELQTEVCVNTNLYSDLKLGEESCKPEESQRFSGQGSPIAITELEEVIIPEDEGARMVFKLYLKNKGNGHLTSPIYMETARLSNQRLICQPEFIEFDEENENIFVCEAVENEPAVYTAPFYAAVYYSYQVIEEDSFTIRNI